MSEEELAPILAEVFAVVAIVAVGDERLQSSSIPSVQCRDTMLYRLCARIGLQIST